MQYNFLSTVLLEQYFLALSMPMKVGVPMLSVIEYVCIRKTVSASLCESPDEVLLLVQVMI